MNYTELYGKEGREGREGGTRCIFFSSGKCGWKEKLIAFNDDCYLIYKEYKDNSFNGYDNNLIYLFRFLYISPSEE